MSYLCRIIKTAVLISVEHVVFYIYLCAVKAVNSSYFLNNICITICNTITAWYEVIIQTPHLWFVK